MAASRRHIFLRLLFILLLMISIIAFFGLMLPGRDPSLMPYVFLSFGFLAVSLLGLQDQWRLAAEVEEDLQRNCIETFELTTPDASEKPRPREFEVLPSSGRVLTFDRQPPRNKARHRPIEVAQRPQDAKPDLEGKRTLSQAELTELKEIAQAHSKQLLPLTPILCLLLVGASASTLSMYGTASVITLAASSLGAAYGWSSHFRRFKESGRVQRDAESGKVEIREAQHDGRLAEVEVLPNSGYWWTLDGLPTPWRKLAA